MCSVNLPNDFGRMWALYIIHAPFAKIRLIYTVFGFLKLIAAVLSNLFIDKLNL